MEGKREERERAGKRDNRRYAPGENAAAEEILPGKVWQNFI